MTDKAVKKDLAGKELERIKQLIENGDVEMRRDWSLSEVPDSIDRPRSPRNYLHSTPFSKLVPEYSLESNFRSETSQQLPNLERWGENLEERPRLDLEGLQNTLNQDLDPAPGNHDGKSADSKMVVEGLGKDDQEFVLEAPLLDESEKENEDEEYHDAEEKMSDEDYLFYDEAFQEGTPDHQNPSIGEELKDHEPFFGQHLFENPLQALEDQENGFYDSQAEPLMPARPREKRHLLSKTLLTRFMATKPKSRPRMPGRPGRFINPPGGQVLFLIVHGIKTNGVQPERRDIELRGHPTLGQYVSFSSPLRHCWTYISSN